MNNLSLLLKKHWPLIIIFFLGLVPLIWFRSGTIIAGGDNSFYLNSPTNLNHYLYAWFDKTDSGMPSLERPKIFPMSPFWFVGQKIGVSLINIQRFWIVLHFMFPGIFMYLLIGYLYDSSGEKGKIAGLVGACLYMFNFLVIVDAFQMVLRPVLTFLPLMMFFWIKGLSEEKFSLKYSLLVGLTSLLYGSANINFAGVIPIYLILTVYTLFFLVTTRRFKHGLIFFFSSVFFIIFSNLWWLMNFYFSSIKTSDEVIELVRSYNFLNATGIGEAFRTMGFWAFLQQFNGKTLLPFALSYYRFPLLLLTFFIPVFAFSSLLFKKGIHKKVFFAFLALLGIFMAKGANQPFGFFYQFLYDKVSGFSAFREPFTKFTLIHVFAFSVLLGFFVEDLSNFIKSNKNRRFLQPLLVFIAIFIILTASYPLLFGKHIQNESWYNDSRYSLYVKVPDYWKEANSWFKKNDPDSKLMLFPKSFYGHTYNWESGISSGAPVAFYFLPNPIISSPGFIYNSQSRLAQLAYLTLFLGEKADLSVYFDLFAIGHVLQQNDASANNETGVFDPLIMRRILKNQKNLKFVTSIGKLDVYSVAINGYSLQVYIPQRTIYLDGKLESLHDILSFYRYQRGDGFVFLKEKDSFYKNPDSSKNNSLYFVNLKEKQKIKEVNRDYTFDIEIPRKGAYKLLSNEYLFKPEFKIPSVNYYINLNGKNLVIPSEGLNQWREAKIGVLEAGNYTLKTNFLIEEIKPEYLTSPFWLIADKEGQDDSPISVDRQLSFTKINPSRYEVRVKNSQEPYILVLSETFNREWRVYFNHKEIKADHFLANGYANGWYLEPSYFGAENDYLLELKYRPQKFTDITSIISIVTIFLLLLYLIITFLKERLNKKNI